MLRKEMAKIRCPKCGSENIKQATLVRGGYWLEGVYSLSPFFVCRKCGYADIRSPKTRLLRLVLLLVIIFWIVVFIIALTTKG
jgi:predicted RNA-binding Zn-ribbon protein involved in translation (DUF1610 family)